MALDQRDATLTIRPGRCEDAAVVAKIYNAGIAERIATFETRPRSAEELERWASDGRPFIVAERAGQILGWARAAPYSDRCVYEGVGEHAVYVSPRARCQGLGRRLLLELCTASERQGLYKLTSRLFADNLAS